MPRPPDTQIDGVDRRPPRRQGQCGGQAQGHQLERAQGQGADAVAHLEVALRLLEQVAADGRGDRAGDGDRRGHAVAARLVQAHDEVAAAVVGDLDGVDLDARARSRVTTGAGSARRAVAAAVDDPQRQVEALGLGDDVGEAGPVREQRQRHRVAALVGVGVGVLRRPGQADPHARRRTGRGRSARR